MRIRKSLTSNIILFAIKYKLPLCQCGCGKEVKKITNKYINGHNKPQLGKPLSIERKEKISKAHILTEVQVQKKQTCLKNLGVENPSQSEIIKHQKIKTNLKHRGVEYPMQSEKVKEQVRKTSKDHWGYNHPMQSETVKETYKQACIERWGFRYYFQTPQARKCSRITHIKIVETQRLNGEPLMPCIGSIERICLNTIQPFIPYKIIRNDHSVFDLVAFFPDGHIPELKLFIEFDEDHHFEDKKEMTILKQKDIDRQLVLESIPGYRVFRISEKQWNENKEQVILNFKQLIESRVGV